MHKVFTYLVLFWLLILTIFSCYVVKAERSFLKFADFVLDDNLKNVVQSGGDTFYVVSMVQVSVPYVDKTLSFWTPLYISSKNLGQLIDWKRKQFLMVKEFENIDFDSRMAAMKADQYLKQRLSELQSRQKATVKNEKRKHA